jgi:transposase-like protein
MECPHCGHEKSLVSETRRAGTKCYRGRKCCSCNKKFVSVEYTDAEMRFPEEITESTLARLYHKNVGKVPGGRRRDDPPLGTTLESAFAGWRRKEN